MFQLLLTRGVWSWVARRPEAPFHPWQWPKLVFWAWLVFFGITIPGCAAVPTVTATPTATPAESDFVVLCYHRFVIHVDSEKKPWPYKYPLPSPYRFPLDEFRWQLQYLKDNGITPVSLEQVKDYWFRGKPLPPKAVLLTFDDGFKSIYEKAYPVMKEFGYPGVLFLYTDFLRSQGDCLKYPDIVEMHAHGFDLQSHSKSHPNLGLEAEKRLPEDFDVFLKEQMDEPIQFLQDRFHVKIDTLAYPYGVFNDQVLKQVKDSGYVLAFTVDPGPNDRTVPPLLLRRNLVLYPLSHENFAKIFQTKVLHLSSYWPREGEMIYHTRPMFSAILADDVVPSSIQFHLGDHSMSFHYDPKTHRLTHRAGGALRPGGHMLCLSAVDTQGNERTYSWYFREKHKNLHPLSATGTPMPTPQTEEEGEGE